MSTTAQGSTPSGGQVSTSLPGGKKTQGRKPLSRAMYDLIVEGYRKAPGNASACARHAGVDRQTAARGWSRGWKQYPWAVPAKQVLEAEQLAARARAAELAREAEAKAQIEREKAAREHVEAKAQELSLLKVARHDAFTVLSALARLAPAVEALSAQVVKDCTPDPATGKLSVTADQALKRLNLVALALQRASSVMGEVIAQGRLERGQATAVVGVVAQADANLSYEQAVEELESIEELKQALASRGHLLKAAITVEAELPDEAE